MKRNFANANRIAPSKEGFTLLEVLVVIVIVGILSAIAAPSWLAFLNRQRTNAVRSDLYSTLQQAQRDAEQLRATRTVAIVPAATAGGVPMISYNGVNQKLGGEIPRNTVTLSGSANGVASTTISFDYRGTPQPGGTSLPFVFSVTSSSVQGTRCVIVASLLGSLKTAENAACTNVNVTP